MAGGNSFPLSPKGSKAPKFGALRGHSEFKLLTGFRVPKTCVSKAMVKVKPCRYKRCILSILQLKVQTKRLVKKSTGSYFSGFQNKIYSRTNNKFDTAASQSQGAISIVEAMPSLFSSGSQIEIPENLLLEGAGA